MGISVVSAGKTFTTTIQGVEFTLVRLTPDQESALTKQATVRGNVDIVRLSELKLKAIVKGWGEGIVVDGEAAQYSPDLVWTLPDTVRSRILEVVSDGDPMQTTGTT